MNIIATFISPDRESRIISPTGGKIVIGRDKDADISLDHPSVSRTHARITLIDGKSHFFLEDCQSGNGTFLEGVQVEKPVTLYSDQNMEIGPFRFQICKSPKTSTFPCESQKNDTGLPALEESIGPPPGRPPAVSSSVPPLRPRRTVRRRHRSGIEGLFARFLSFPAGHFPYP